MADTVDSFSRVALPARDDLLRIFFETANVGICIVGPDSRFVEVNGAYADLLGYGPEELLGRSFLEVTHPDDVERNVKVWSEGYRERGRFRIEKRYVRKDGRVVWVDVSSTMIPGRDGSMALAFNTVIEISERKRLECDLASAVERLAATLTSIGDAVMATDSDGRVELMNAVAEQLTGWPLAEARGRPLREVFTIRSEATGLPVHPPVSRVLRDGVTIGLANEAILVDRRGVERAIADSAAPIRRDGGALAGVVVVFRDVTREREAERALRESEGRFRALWSSSLVGICIVDREGRYVDANSTHDRITGYTRDELRGRTVLDITHPDDVAASVAMIERMWQTGEGLRLEKRYVRPDGEAVWVDVAAELAREPGCGEPQVSYAIVTDISERKRAEAELRIREQAIEAAGEGILITEAGDPEEGKILYANTAFEHLTGYAPAEVVGRTAQFLVGDETEAETLAEIREALVAGRRFAGELVSYRKDGTPFVNRLTIATMRDGQGRPTYTVGILDDVSEERRLEQQLVAAQRMEAIGRLAGGIAHDFNNLLTAITGYSELVLDRLPEADPARADVAEIRRASERAAALTRQLLAFSKRQVLQPVVLDLNAIVRDMQLLLERLIGEDLELAVVLDPDLPRVSVDPAQLEQVIANLVVNARDALPGGGRIEVTTRSAEAVEAGQPDGEWVCLAVHDDGVGMDEATRLRAFEPFFTTKGEGEGTGLGLATVYGIVAQSGGIVDIESEPGQGTTVRAFFPAVR